MLDVRLLAALDLHRARGTRLRRALVLSEFAAGATVGVAVGVWVAVVAGSTGWRIFGIAVAGVGLNYLPLQFWVAMPFLFLVLAARRSARNRR